MTDASITAPRSRARLPKDPSGGSFAVQGQRMAVEEPFIEDEDVILPDEDAVEEPFIEAAPPPLRPDAAISAPVPEQTTAAPRGWYDMKDAPSDGKVVVLQSDDPVNFPATEAVWRHTRCWDSNGGKWRNTAFWAISNSGGKPVPFAPIGWRPL